MSRYPTAEETEAEYIEAMGSDLGRFYNLLVKECSLLHLEWAEYKVLFGTNPERIALLNCTAPTFFFQLQNSQWESAILHIARMMDPPNSGVSKENVALRKLTELVDPAIQYKIDMLIKVAREKCKFSQDWRNRHIAHRDLGLAMNGSAKPLEAASRLVVDGALEAIAAVLNAVESHYRDGRTVAYQFVIEPLGGAMALLHTLRSGLEANEASEQRLISGQLLPEDVERRRPL